MHLSKISTTARTIVTALCMGLFMLSGSAFSHGGKKHLEDEVKKEQYEWGIPGETTKVARTFTITMADTMRFTPEKILVKQGETVKLVMRNKGRILHEFVLGTQKTLDQHAALMLKFPKMEHDEPYMTHVPPGKSGTVTWTFNRPGEFDFACLIDGHYSAGMKGKISVSPN